MATGNMRPIGIGGAGLVFAVAGVIFLIADKIAIGIVMFAMAVVFVAVGVAAARKAPPPDDRTETRTPAP
jgi:hypothetical protein